MKSEPTVESSQLYRALGHPIRARALELLCEGPASPSELARRMDVRLATVSYHVRVLAAAGWADLVETRPRRGAIEHVYQGSEKARSRLLMLDETARHQLLAAAEALFEKALELEGEAAARVAANSGSARFGVTLVTLVNTASPPAPRDSD